MYKNAMNRIGNCSRCGKVFVRYRQQSLCPACTEKREQDFMRCRDYLRDNPETRMKELSEATGVSVREIIQFIIEGRLVLTKDNPNMFYHCESCGKRIRSGRLCSQCEKRLTDEVEKVVQKKHDRDSLHSNVRHKYRIYKPKN